MRIKRKFVSPLWTSLQEIQGIPWLGPTRSCIWNSWPGFPIPGIPGFLRPPSAEHGVGVARADRKNRPCRGPVERRPTQTVFNIARQLPEADLFSKDLVEFGIPLFMFPHPQAFVGRASVEGEGFCFSQMGEED